MRKCWRLRSKHFYNFWTSILIKLIWSIFCWMDMTAANQLLFLFGISNKHTCIISYGSLAEGYVLHMGMLDKGYSVTFQAPLFLVTNKFFCLVNSDTLFLKDNQPIFVNNQFEKNTLQFFLKTQKFRLQSCVCIMY